MVIIYAMSRTIEVIGIVKKNIAEMVKSVANCTLELMGQPDMLDVTVYFVSEREIRRLNRVNRGIDKVTDVLSFPSTDTRAGEVVDATSLDNLTLLNDCGNLHLGDMAICLKRADEQAKEYGSTLEAEVKKLVIHSLLHLLGYDHISDEDYIIMNEKEKELDLKIKI